MATAHDETSMRQHIECPVCNLVYNATEKKPKQLMCGHTICQECLQRQGIHKLPTEPLVLTCPQDNRQYLVPNNCLDDIPNNLTALNILEHFCEECHSMPKKQECIREHCSKVLCEDCRRLHCEDFHKTVRNSLLELQAEAERMQAICDDESDIIQIQNQSDAAIAEVTRMCDGIKEMVIDQIRSRSEKSREAYGAFY